MNPRELIEYFHLSFCHRLLAKVDRKIFCLKGGCNLRFYFHSIRYSEDIDFDVHTVSVETLKKNVEKVLTDSVFQALLEHQGIEIVEWSAPKQTPTTQRWKISLKFPNQTLRVPTKLEFSRRKEEFTQSEITPIPISFIEHYQLQNIILQHYSLKGAIEQKVNALIHRTETQARDIIDLKILIDQLKKSDAIVFSNTEVKQAIETLTSVSFDHFKSQVWPYLMTEFQDLYKSRQSWDQIQEQVLKFIEKSGRKK